MSLGCRFEFRERFQFGVWFGFDFLVLNVIFEFRGFEWRMS